MFCRNFWKLRRYFYTSGTAKAVQELASLLLKGTYLANYNRDRQFGSPLQKDRTQKQKQNGMRKQLMQSDFRFQRKQKISLGVSMGR